jgi:type I restriction enzyme R subunit
MIQADTLKSGWKLVKFGDVVRLSKERAANPEAEGIELYVGLEHIDPDDLRIRRWGLVAEGITFTSKFKPGQVLFGKRRAYQRKVAVADFEGVCSGDIYVFESANPKVLLPELLPFICQTDRFFEYAVGTSAGSLSPRTNWTSLANFKFALPPIEEQKKVKELLSKSQINYESVQNALKILITLRKSAIDELCKSYTGQSVLLGEICEIQNGRSFSSNYYQDQGIKLLRPGNLGENGYLNWNINNTMHLPDNCVLVGRPKKGLIWHFQGSGKSLLMVFAAQKMRLQSKLRNPTVIIVVDRIDLDAQISATFYASDIPNLVKAETRTELERLLRQDTRKIIITTIFKFGEADGVLNERENIIVLVDEAHRTQEGDLGIKMRAALPNAFLFGFTGTPINQRDRNTFYAFGAEEDERGYMSRYGFEESLRDGATLPLHFEPRLLEMHIDHDAIDQAYGELTGGLSDLDRENLAKAASRMAVLVKAPERIANICADIAQHYNEKVAPNGFKAMVVTYDQECCLLYKAELEKHLPSEASEIIISATGKDERFKPYQRTRDQEEKLLNRFRDRNDPMKILVVTAKLLTGFDAPILQAMYLDKPLKAHTLLQAICRTNRTYGSQKTHGFVVDYLGVFDDVAQALEFDEQGFQQVVSGIATLKNQLPGAIQKCLGYFLGVDRTLTGYEGLIAAQECLPNNDTRDNFAADYSHLSNLWEAISPDPILQQYEIDYKWLSQVYVSVQPTTGMGRLIWHALGAKTIELIHENISVEAVRDDLDEIVLDAELLEVVLNSPDPRKKSQEIEIKIANRLRKYIGNSRFLALSERLEAIKERHEQGQIYSVTFLKELLDLARDLLLAEKDTPVESEENTTID